MAASSIPIPIVVGPSRIAAWSAPISTLRSATRIEAQIVRPPVKSSSDAKATKCATRGSAGNGSTPFFADPRVPAQTQSRRPRHQGPRPLPHRLHPRATSHTSPEIPTRRRARLRECRVGQRPSPHLPHPSRRIAAGSAVASQLPARVPRFLFSYGGACSY